MTESADVFAPEIIESGLVQNILNIIEYQSAEMAQAMLPIQLGKMFGMPARIEDYEHFANIAARSMIINKELVQELKKLIPAREELRNPNELYQEELSKRIEDSELGQRLILIQTEGPKAKVDRLAKEGVLKP